MPTDKFIVCLSASYCDPEKLFKDLKKYSPFSDERFAYWNEFAFTTDLLPECDALIILNTPFQSISTLCDPARVIAFMMEPGDRNHHPWMYKGLGQYAKVYSPIVESGNTVKSHGYLGWHVQQDYQDLRNLSMPAKTKDMSCISSGLTTLKGHRRRLAFVNALKQNVPGIDFFGKAENYVPDKMTGLLPYRYSIAIENTASEDYFTEKINDCFLAYTVPLYYGCRNIGKYFPDKSFITIDIDDTSGSLNKVREVIADDDWELRTEALKEARQLVLEKYQPLAGAASILRSIDPSDKQKVNLMPVQRGIPEKLRNALNKFLTD